MRNSTRVINTTHTEEFWARNNTTQKDAMGMLSVLAQITHILDMDIKAANYEADFKTHINQIVNNVYQRPSSVLTLERMLGEPIYLSLLHKVKDYEAIIKIFNDCWLQFSEDMQQILLKNLQFKIDNQNLVSQPNLDYQMVYDAWTSQALLEFPSTLTTIIGEFAGYNPQAAYPQSDINTVLTGSATLNSDTL